MNKPRSIYEAFPDLEARWSAFAKWEKLTSEFYVSQLHDTAKSVLEPGCGYGRILAPLARLGIEVCGFDSVPARIELAQSQNLDNAEFFVAEMPEIPTSRTFDAVILTVNAIGYLLSSEAKLQLFRNIASALNPGGRLLFDFQRGERTLRWLRSWSSLVGQIGEDELHSRIRWDASDDCIVEEFSLLRDHESKMMFQDRLRFGTIREMQQLLAAAGFEITNRWGKFDGSPFRPWSQTAIWEARSRSL